MDPFASARLRINGARDNLLDFDRLAAAYIDSHPYARVVEDDAEGIFLYKSFKIKLTKAPPEKLGLICSYAIENLRAALDHAAYAAAELSRASNLKAIHFPMASSATYFEQAVRDNCKGIHPEIVALFRALKPYKGGDDLLWCINPLRQCSEHRLIRPVGHATYRGKRWNFLHLKSGAFKAPITGWDSVKNEIVLLKVAPGTELNADVSVALYIAFGDVEIVGGQPVDGVLGALISKVDGIVAATEAEAKRIGLLP
jgi:hypothetical protein